MEEIIFSETGTLGIRRQNLWRSILPRQQHTVETEYGHVLGKVAWGQGGHAMFNPEFESCRELAMKSGRPLRVIYRVAVQAFDQNQPAIENETPLCLPDATTDVHDHHGHSHDHDIHDHDHDYHGHDH